MNTVVNAPTTFFTGFTQPKENWSKLPHQFIEALPMFVGKAEMAVVLYILRHTWGYGDESKKISIDEFEHGRKRSDGTRIDSGAGISRPSIVTGLRQAEEHGFIRVEVDDADAGRVKKSYSLVSGGGLKNLTPEVKKFNPRGKNTLPRTEKETNRKTKKKKPICKFRKCQQQRFGFMPRCLFRLSAKRRGRIRAVKVKSTSLTRVLKYFNTVKGQELPASHHTLLKAFIQQHGEGKVKAAIWASVITGQKVSDILKGEQNQAQPDTASVKGENQEKTNVPNTSSKLQQEPPAVKKSTDRKSKKDTPAVEDSGEGKKPRKKRVLTPRVPEWDYLGMFEVVAANSFSVKENIPKTLAKRIGVVVKSLAEFEVIPTSAELKAFYRWRVRTRGDVKYLKSASALQQAILEWRQCHEYKQFLGTLNEVAPSLTAPQSYDVIAEIGTYSIDDVERMFNTLSEKMK